MVRMCSVLARGYFATGENFHVLTLSCFIKLIHGLALLICFLPPGAGHVHLVRIIIDLRFGWPSMLAEVLQEVSVFYIVSWLLMNEPEEEVRIIPLSFCLV